MTSCTRARGPWFGFLAGCAKDGLSGPVHRVFGVVPNQDRNGLGKQFLAGFCGFFNREFLESLVNALDHLDFAIDAARTDDRPPARPSAPWPPPG